MMPLILLVEVRKIKSSGKVTEQYMRESLWLRSRMSYSPYCDRCANALRADGWTHRFWGFFFLCIFMFYSTARRFCGASRKIQVPGWSEASFWRYDPEKIWPQMAPVWILIPLDIFPLPSIFVSYKNIWNKSKQIDKERTFRLFEIETNEETKSNLLSTYWNQNCKEEVVKLIISKIILSVRRWSEDSRQS